MKKAMEMGMGMAVLMKGAVVKVADRIIRRLIPTLLHMGRLTQRESV
jgi:hypothetical protein